MKSSTKIVRWLSIRAVALGLLIRSLATLDAQLIRANLQVKRLISFFRTDTLRAWGYLDAMSILLYCASSTLHGRVPYYSDLKSALWLAQDHGSYVYPLISAGFIAHGSLFVSAILLILRWPPARFLAYVQTPLRAFSFTLSVAPLFLLVELPFSFFGMPIVVITISETIKIRSLRRYAQSKKLNLTTAKRY